MTHTQQRVMAVLPGKGLHLRHNAGLRLQLRLAAFGDVRDRMRSQSLQVCLVLVCRFADPRADVPFP